MLNRLKSHSGLIEKILWLFALGVDASTIEVFGVRDITIRTWLWYSEARKEAEKAFYSGLKRFVSASFSSRDLYAEIAGMIARSKFSATYSV